MSRSAVFKLLSVLSNSAAVRGTVELGLSWNDGEGVWWGVAQGQ